MHGGTLADALIARMGVGVVVWRLANLDDPTSLHLVFANPAASRMAKVDLSSSTGKTMGELFPAASARGRPTVYAEVVASGREILLEQAVYAECGDDLVAGRMVPLPNQCVAILFEGVTDKRADDARGLTAFLDSIVDNIPAKVFVKDAKHLRFELVNRTAEKMSGLRREDMYGKGDHDFFPKEQADFFQARDREVLESGRMLDIPEEPVDYPDGRTWLHTKKIPLLGPDGRPEHLLGISLDITDRKLAVEALRKAHEELEVRVRERTNELVEANAQLKREIDERKRTQEALEQTEEHLRHAQKMEAVGKLAGGIAHDFNNLLSVIISYAHILSKGLDPADPLAQGLDEIKKSGERAAELTRQLLAFGRQQVLAPRVMGLNDIIGTMDKMLRRLIGEDLELTTKLAHDLARIKADPGQIEQIIMNLVVNARDAMPGGGRLTIETANVELNDVYARDRHVAPGPYVMLVVTDTGTGMDKATLGRIFEPFFTTKAQGKGTGLGLSTVFGIVEQSGGHIDVDSELGKGTTFRIYFARTEDAPTTDAIREDGDPSLRGSETILLVEDERQVRLLAHKILDEHGYNVLTAASPREAIRISRERAEPIDLLVTDIVMPEMNGRTLSEQLLPQRREMEVLFISGYADSVLGEDDLSVAEIRFLQKPITPLTLTRTVREILDAKPRRQSQSM